VEFGARKPAMPVQPVLHKATVVAPAALQRKISVQTAIKPMPIKALPALWLDALRSKCLPTKASLCRAGSLDLKAKGLNSFLIKKGDFWLVCLGPFQTQNIANEMLKRSHPNTQLKRKEILRCHCTHHSRLTKQALHNAPFRPALNASRN